MSPRAKQVLGTVLTAAVTAGVAFLAPAYQEGALAAFALVMGALHIPRPGDVRASDVEIK